MERIETNDIVCKNPQEKFMLMLLERIDALQDEIRTLKHVSCLKRYIQFSISSQTKSIYPDNICKIAEQIDDIIDEYDKHLYSPSYYVHTCMRSYSIFFFCLKDGIYFKDAKEFLNAEFSESYKVENFHILHKLNNDAKIIVEKTKNDWILIDR